MSHPPPELNVFSVSLGGNFTQGGAQVTIREHYKRVLALYGYTLIWIGEPRGEPDGSSIEAQAQDTEGRKVNIKILGTSSRQLNILSKLSSQSSNSKNHTMPILKMVLDGDKTLIFTPSFKCHVGTYGIRGPGEYLGLALQCLEGLSFMHNLLIAHLGISPSNICLADAHHTRGRSFVPTSRCFFRGFANAIQFQLACGLEQKMIHSSQTSFGYRNIPGVGPNQLINPFAADVYALARTLKTQIAHDQDACTLSQARSSPSTDLLRICPEYVHLLDKMMEPNPSKRITAATALAELKLIWVVAQTRLHLL